MKCCKIVCCNIRNLSILGYCNKFFAINLVVPLSFCIFARNNLEYIKEWKLSLGNIGY